MRVALLSDIHGNSIALESVLTDIAGQGGANAYWILGDLVALGPDPIGVLEQLSALSRLGECSQIAPQPIGIAIVQQRFHFLAGALPNWHSLGQQNRTLPR
jgi:predicted phosphodiesterase